MVGIQKGDFMTVRYSIKAINHLKVTGFLWQTALLIYVAGYFINFDQEIFLVVFAFYSLFAIPSIYLHTEYLIKNGGQAIRIEGDRFVVIQRSKSVDYKFTDMKKVILYKSASLDKGGIPLSPVESYHYARIVTKSNEELIITCLLVPKVDEAINLLKGVKFERKKRPFCTIFWK